MDVINLFVQHVSKVAAKNPVFVIFISVKNVKTKFEAFFFLKKKNENWRGEVQNFQMTCWNFLGFQLWYGEEGFQVYSQVHQDPVNRLIHVFGSAVIIYSVLLWIYYFTRKSGIKVSRICVVVLWTLYSNFYEYVGNADQFIWVFLMFPIMVLADKSRKLHKSKFWPGVLFLSCLIIQEVIGHTYFERANSRLTLSHVTNAVLYTPFFYSRYIHNFLICLLGYNLGSILVIILGGFGSFLLYERI